MLSVSQKIYIYKSILPDCQWKTIPTVVLKILVKDHPRAVFRHSAWEQSLSMLESMWQKGAVKCLWHLDVFQSRIQKARCAEQPMAEMFFVGLLCGFVPLVRVKAADVQKNTPSYFTFWSSQAFCNFCLNSHTSQLGLVKEKVLFFLMSPADPMPDYTQSRAALAPCSANYAELQ